MKYISLFSGIGGFEIAIHTVFPDAQCVGYSEIDKYACMVYDKHFPDHNNLGNIQKITEKDIQQIIQTHNNIDLLVAGFPCQNLSSLSNVFSSTNSDGLQGPKSSLFYDMTRIIGYIQKHNPKDINILVENNASMSISNQNLITSVLENVFQGKLFKIKLNASDFGVQIRRRLYWTTFPIDTTSLKSKKFCTQTWKDILEPIKDCKQECVSDKMILNGGNKEYPSKSSKYKLTMIKTKDNRWKYIKEEIKGITTKWQMRLHSDNGKSKDIPYNYLEGKCTPYIRRRQFDNLLIDRRTKDGFLVRHFLTKEVERLFFLPEGWVSEYCSRTRSSMLLGNTVVVKVIEFLLKDLRLN